MKIISGSANEMLAFQVAKGLGLPLTTVEHSNFANGEQRIRILEDLTGHSVVIVQSCSPSTDQTVIELLLLADAARQAGAVEIRLVIPWLGYSLLDKVTRPGEPNSVQVVAKIISTCNADRVYFLDLHNPNIMGHFSIPTEHLSAVSIFADYARQEIINENTLVVSPDLGGKTRASSFASQVGLPVVSFEKKRNYTTGKIESLHTTQEVRGSDIILFDDAIQSGGTALRAANELKNAGAKKIVMFVSHLPMASSSIQVLEKSPIQQLVTTNSIDFDGKFSNIVLTTLDISPVLIDAIKNNMKAS